MNFMQKVVLGVITSVVIIGGIYFLLSFNQSATKAERWKHIPSEGILE